MKPITPHLWFDKEAKEAAQFYCSVFPNSKITSVRTLRNTPSGDCDIVAFELNGQPFMAISAGPLFKFNESISFMVSCETQAEIDRYWETLSAVPAAEQCGWLKDKYGLSWQIVPAAMNEMLQTGTPEQTARVTQAFLKMKKLEIAELQRASEGGSRQKPREQRKHENRVHRHGVRRLERPSCRVRGLSITGKNEPHALRDHERAGGHGCHQNQKTCAKGYVEALSDSRL